MASPSNSFIQFGQAVFLVYPYDRIKEPNFTMLGGDRQEQTFSRSSFMV